MVGGYQQAMALVSGDPNRTTFELNLKVDAALWLSVTEPGRC
jgi:hypothetical protein